MRRRLPLEQMKNALAGSQVRPRAQPGVRSTPTPAPPRRVYNKMDSLPLRTPPFDKGDCMWAEDNTQTGNEVGQYKFTLENGPFPRNEDNYTYQPIKVFYGDYSNNALERSWNISSITYELLGIYRVRPTTLTLSGIDLGPLTMVIPQVYTPSKIDEGFVYAQFYDYGDDGSSYFDIHLGETWISGQNMRFRDYQLGTNDVLWFMGVADYQDPDAISWPDF